MILLLIGVHLNHDMKTPLSRLRSNQAERTGGRRNSTSVVRPRSDNPVFSPAELEAVRRLDSCTVANTIETFHERLRDEGFTDKSIRCLFPRLPVMLGFAATVRIRGSTPPTAGGLYPDRTDWWDYLLSLPSPRVVVIEDVSVRPGFGSLLGAVHVNILRALGCAGAVTNGAVRDIPVLEKLGFPVFAGNLTVSHAYIHILDFGRPVQIAGLAIRSGDLVHGDVHGVQTIPLDLIPRIPEVAAKISARDAQIIAFCQSDDFSLEKLKSIVR